MVRLAIAVRLTKQRCAASRDTPPFWATCDTMGKTIQLFEPWSIVDRIDRSDDGRWTVEELASQAAHFADVPFELNNPVAEMA